MQQTSSDRFQMSRFWIRRNAMLDATIAIWGAEKAGKTAYLAALELAAKREGVSIFSANSQTEKIMKALREGRSKHQFPSPTHRPTCFEDLCVLRFGLKSPKMNFPITLNIVDAAGSWWLESAADVHDGSQASNPYDLILSKCDGLICLMDPTQALKRAHISELVPDSTMDASADAALQTMLARLRRSMMSGNGGLNLKIAVCLTQMDRAEHYGHLGREEEYFRRLYGNIPMHNWVSGKRWQFFGCSAVGVLQRGGHVISNTYKDHAGQEVILESGVLPIHVLRPIQWILDLG